MQLTIDTRQFSIALNHPVRFRFRSGRKAISQKKRNFYICSDCGDELTVSKEGRKKGIAGIAKERMKGGSLADAEMLVV